MSRVVLYTEKKLWCWWEETWKLILKVHENKIMITTGDQLTFHKSLGPLVTVAMLIKFFDTDTASTLSWVGEVYRCVSPTLFGTIPAQKPPDWDKRGHRMSWRDIFKLLNLEMGTTTIKVKGHRSMERLKHSLVDQTCSLWSSLMLVQYC